MNYVKRHSKPSPKPKPISLRSGEKPGDDEWMEVPACLGLIPKEAALERKQDP